MNLTNALSARPPPVTYYSDCFVKNWNTGSRWTAYAWVFWFHFTSWRFVFCMCSTNDTSWDPMQTTAFYFVGFEPEFCTAFLTKWCSLVYRRAISLKCIVDWNLVFRYHACMANKAKQNEWQCTTTFWTSTCMCFLEWILYIIRANTVAGRNCHNSPEALRI